MVDAHALGACGLGRAGSTPASPTIFVGLRRNQSRRLSRVDTGLNALT